MNKFKIGQCKRDARRCRGGIEIMAESFDEALRIARRQFPKRQGFAWFAQLLPYWRSSSATRKGKI
jgi:hypothetical protein